MDPCCCRAFVASFLLCALLGFSQPVAAQSTDSLTVKVRNDADNSPIEGARVRLYDDADTLVAEKTTGADGNVGFGFGRITGVDDRADLIAAVGTPHPNPFDDATMLPVTLASATLLRGDLYDLLGRRVATDEHPVGSGVHSFVIQPNGMSSGAYLFRVSGGGKDLGSTMIHYNGSGDDGTATIELLTDGIVVADKPAVPGTFRVEVDHPNYRSAAIGDITIVNKVLRFANLRRVEFVAEFGIGTPGFTVVADARSGLDVPRDLEFNPTLPNELWVVNRAFDGTVIYTNPGTPEMASFRVRDKWALHFMEEVSAIAFSEDGLFGTAQESINTYDGQGAGNFFMGPALWTSDTSIYSKQDLEGWGELGSHLDMLHESPNGMGIAHDHDNAYWYFDGYHNNIVYYDFQQDHGPGHDDHADGIVRRYVDANVQRTPGVPGHMVLDKESGWLYIADPGNSRITRLNTKTGARVSDGDINGSQMEDLVEYSNYGNATYEVFVADGLMRPSGIALHNDRLFVTDFETGEIVAYDLAGRELNRIQTPAEDIMGITIGPDGKIWYVDAEQNQLVRIDPQAE